MKESKTNILVIFTCFNRKEKTKNCLDSLKDNITVSLSYIVVDDHSTDGTSKMLGEYDNVVIIQGDGNLFYSGGMRKGIDYAKNTDLSSYSFIMFINDDVLFFPNAIDKLVQYSQSYNEIVVGAVCSIDGTLSYGGAKVKKGFNPGYSTVMSDNNHRIQCDTFCANCVLIPTSVFLKLPNIDKVYHHAMGDFDYGHEATRKGYLITTTDFFVGWCDDNPINNTWRDASQNPIIRLEKKESEKGLPFYQYFHFLRKNHGLLKAVVYSITPYIRIFMGK